MSQSIYVVYNSNSGPTNTTGDLKKIFTELKINVTYIALPKFLQDGLDSKAKKTHRLIVAAGGDGTVSAVAGRIIGTDYILGVLPCGTFNHFAKDINIPTNLKAAAKILLNGNTIKVDVGSVNGRIFVNNSNIGLYPSLVKAREGYALQIGKPLAHIVSTVVAIARLRLYDVQMEIDKEILHRKVPFVFIGNNPYGLDKFGFTNRQALSSGKLCIYIVKANHRWQLIWLFILALLGIATSSSSFEAYSVPKATLSSRKKKITVAIDGEVSMLSSPLTYQVLPKSLSVIVPK